MAVPMTTDVLDVTAFVDRLVDLRDLTAPTRASPDIVRIVAVCDEVAARLAAAPHRAAPAPTDAIEWIASDVDDAIMVVGAGLFVVCAADASSTTIVSDGTSWTIDSREDGAHVARADDERYDRWIVTADGAVVPAAAPDDALVEGALVEHATADAVADAPPSAAWAPTHRVGREALPVGGVPTGSFQPGTTLDPGLPVQVLATTANGWALVVCSNTWQCYVAAHGLLPIGASDG
jgi:hypothetical protein